MHICIWIGNRTNSLSKRVKRGSNRVCLLSIRYSACYRRSRSPNLSLSPSSPFSAQQRHKQRTRAISEGAVKLWWCDNGITRLQKRFCDFLCDSKAVVAFLRARPACDGMGGGLLEGRGWGAGDGFLLFGFLCGLGWGGRRLRAHRNATTAFEPERNSQNRF